MYKLEDIKIVHLEVTQRCQAACPMCDRNQNGGALNPHIDLAELTLNDCKQIFSPGLIKQLTAMYMCGNLGDPIMSDHTLAIMHYFRENNPSMWLSINTNAGARSSQWWQQLAGIINKQGNVIFSVDGLEDTNHIYRQNVQWDKVKDSMQSFIAAGGRARWDFIVFEHNQHQVKEAENLAELWGFEKFTVKKTARFFSTSRSQGKESHQSFNHKGNATINLKKPDIDYQNVALNREEKLIETYGSMDAYYDQTEIRCKVKDEGNIFISAEGIVLPCCWTAGKMYKWYLKDYRKEQIWQFIDAVGKDNLDGRKGLANVFATGIFENIQNSWNKPTCSGGKLKICAQKCGADFDTFSEQFK